MPAITACPYRPVSQQFWGPVLSVMRDLLGPIIKKQSRFGRAAPSVLEAILVVGLTSRSGIVNDFPPLMSISLVVLGSYPIEEFIVCFSLSVRHMNLSQMW